MESRDSAIIIALIIISSIINIGYIFDHERQETAHQSDYNLLLEEIHILQNSVTDLKEQILNIHEILIENRQPEELDIFSLQDLTQGVEYVKLDLNSLNLVDPGNALSTTSDSLK